MRKFDKLFEHFAFEKVHHQNQRTNRSPIRHKIMSQWNTVNLEGNIKYASFQRTNDIREKGWSMKHTFQKY